MFANNIEKPATRIPLKILPSEVHSVLRRHMLADGFAIVFDLEKSHGTYVYDSRTNRELIDFFTFFASGALGLNHPKLREPSFVEKLGRIAVNKPSNSDAYTVELAEFVQTFARFAQPSYLPYAFFIEGGTLGNENALKTAFDWKIQKNYNKGYSREVGTKVIHFRNAFHGRSGYTLSLTNTDPVKIKYYPKFSWPRIHNPILTFPLTEERLDKVKKEEALAISEIKQAIVDNRDDIAALIIEPIQAEGGDNFFRKEFFVELRTICSEDDIMFIIDEVQTGVGATGKMWAHEYYVEPDMMTFGKKMQVCGFVCSKRVDEVADNVFHVPSRINSTFGGNLVDMVRAAKILEIIHEEGLVENSRVVGIYLLENLSTLQSEFPSLLGNARGLGLFCAIDIESKDQREVLRSKAYDKGLILIGCGERTIRFRPPLNISMGEVDEGFAIIRRCLIEMTEERRG